jgi:hypothetical protein
MLLLMTGTTYKRAMDLMEADVGDELVALDVEQGTCFGFNLVAASVWRSLSSPKTFDQLRDDLLAEYEVSVEQCTSELKELLDDLTAKGLIEQA